MKHNVGKDKVGYIAAEELRWVAVESSDGYLFLIFAKPGRNIGHTLREGIALAACTPDASSLRYSCEQDGLKFLCYKLAADGQPQLVTDTVTPTPPSPAKPKPEKLRLTVDNKVRARLAYYDHRKAVLQEEGFTEAEASSHAGIEAEAIKSRAVVDWWQEQNRQLAKKVLGE